MEFDEFDEFDELWPNLSKPGPTCQNPAQPVKTWRNIPERPGGRNQNTFQSGPVARIKTHSKAARGPSRKIEEEEKEWKRMRRMRKIATHFVLSPRSMSRHKLFLIP